MSNLLRRLRNPKTQASWLTLAATIHCTVTGQWLVFAGPALLVIHSYLQDAAARRPPYRHGQQ
jgi:hypothetical protein